MKRLRLLGLLVVEVLKVLDCLLNVLLGIVLIAWALITSQEGEGSFSGETLSARAGRSLLNGKAFGRLLVPLIDALFFWQSHELELPDGTKVSYPSHCYRAFLKKYHKLDMPSEYRRPLPADSREPIAQPHDAMKGPRQ